MSTSPISKASVDESRNSSEVVIPEIQPTIPGIHLLLKYLEAEGVEHIFGIPGGPLMPLYEALFERKKIKHIIAKHEEGAAFMADGYARVSGRLGVCCTTTGPGATNALTGVAVAHQDSVPLLILTAQVALAAFGKGAAQESSPMGIDIVDLYKNVTKASVMLMAPDRMGDIIRHLLRTGLSGRMGPIHMSLPTDMLKRPVVDDVRSPSQYRTVTENFDRYSVKEAAKKLLDAKRPVILAGSGVNWSRSYQELRQLAEKLCIPVATTPKAKGVFPENHLLSLGVFGLANSPRADAVVMSPETDVVLVVGSSLGEVATASWDPRLTKGRTLMQIDIDPREIGKNYSVDVSLVGDAKRVLIELNYQVARDSRWLEAPFNHESRMAYIQSIRAMHSQFTNAEEMDSDTTPLKPQRVMAEMRAALPKDVILFSDIGNSMGWALHYFPIYEPGTFFVNLNMGSMGHGTAAAIGGKLAAPDRVVVSLTGDGSFAMNGMEVHTAVENDIPVIWVVMNNGGHGTVFHGENALFGGKFHTSLFNKPLQIAKMAEALGAKAYVVNKPGELERAIKDALLTRKPCVIEVMIDPMEKPPMGTRYKAVENFYGGKSS